MALSRGTEPITDDEAAIRAALEEAFLPALLPALAHATGDLSLLREELRPAEIAPRVPQAGMTRAQQAAARELALSTIIHLRDHGPAAAPPPVETILRAVMQWMTGSPAAEDYIPLLLEELDPLDEDPRAPRWRKDPAAPFSVAVIGAGMSGIVASIRLKQAGVPFTIIEKNGDVGGTWYENQYPGARVDVSNAFYSYSFAQRTDWPDHYSPQGVLLDYFREVADGYDLRPHVRFNTEVLSATWDEGRLRWRLRLRTPDGGEETLEANAVISAVGQLNQPLIPEIAGQERFQGPAFHSARWDHGVDLTGKRVAVIGTGASAAQFIPAIAEQVAELTVFQRTPPWLVPVPHYYDHVPEGLRWVFAHVPYYSHWYRFWLFWTTTEGLLPAATVDDDWDGREESVGARNAELRQLLAGYIHSQFADRPDLLEQVLPKYAPASKRLVLDNGIWARTLKRDNVRLVTDGIAAITERGVRAQDGAEYPADVLIYGTGFQASRFLTPMTVHGRGGAVLDATWDGDARAYMGITVPGFPNLFLMYGPNTNIVVNGSIIYFSECETQYILGCLRLLLEGGHAALDVRRQVHDAYNERIDAANRKRVWGVATVPSWYRNARGRSAQNWPFNLFEYWQQTREPNPADYELMDPVPAGQLVG